MGVWVAAAAAAIGGGLSFMGASKQAKETKRAIKKGMRDETALFNKWSSNLDDLIGEKEDKLYNLGGIFDRFESTGAFGDTDTLRNLRQAQDDFSSLAAGDFSGFESQIRKSMSDALVNTVGSGAPIGTFAGLAADTQLNYRLQGVQTATGITDFLSNQANQLLGLEFGVMDQRFQVGYELERAKVSNINNMRMQQAAQEGVDWMAAGMGVSQAGSAIGSAMQYQNNMNFQQQSHNDQMALLNQQMNGRSQATVNPINIAPTQSYIPQSYTPFYSARDTSITLPAGSGMDETLGVLPPLNDPTTQSGDRAGLSYWSVLNSAAPFAQVGMRVLSGMVP